jgi:prepilin-type N-terminal cleavage/methylation domain-containing protein
MKQRNDHGFSLVEVLVAAGVIALSLLSTVAFIRKGQEFLAVDKHRRMARSIIERTLEVAPYQVENYNNLVATTSPPPATDVVIDAETNPNLHGSLTVTVSDEQAGVSGQVVPYRVVTAKVIWTEPAGGNDTVTIEQWLSNIQRD